MDDGPIPRWLLTFRFDPRLRAVIAPRVVAVGLLVTIGVVLAQAVSQLIDFRVFDLGLRALDSNHHASVFGAVSLLAQVTAAGSIGLRAVRPARRRRAWLALGALVALLVIIRTFTTYDTAILVPPLAVVVGLIGWLTLRDPGDARALVWGALGLLAFSFALHGVGMNADATRGYLDHTWAYQMTGVFKHGAELAGWMLLSTAMIAVGLAAPTVRRLDGRLSASIAGANYES